MAEFKGWERLEKLGEGGQGEVYKARSPMRAEELRNLAKQIGPSMGRIASISTEPEADALEFTKLMSDAVRPDEATSLGELKIFKIPEDPAEASKVVGRLNAEIGSLKRINHPAVLKLLDSDVNERFIVTEFHESGTLDDKKNLMRYKGRALEALIAFRPLVEAIALIHKERDAIHRDIKLKNIFIGKDGRLVLGDFGIVFLRDGERMTETYERVGSRDWMAPWANTQRRLALEDVNSSLDIYPLGKVLWCMVSGSRNLHFWYYNRDGNDLEELFPGDPAMRAINHILAKCIVEDERNCLKSADELLALVDETIEKVRHPSRQPRDGSRWPCLVCGQGYYEGPNSALGPITSFAAKQMKTHEEIPCGLWICGACGHCQVFADVRVVQNLLGAR
jgi:serine/threonine protein kinase